MNEAIKMLTRSLIILGMAVTGLTMFAALADSTGAPHRPIRWLFHGPGIEAIAADEQASRLLDGTRPFVMKGRAGPTIPPAWNAIPFVSFTSFRALKNSVERGTLPPDVKGIMYDNERWKFTPEAEQQAPAQYERLAADLAHSRGLLFLSAPATNLVTALAPESL
jgi:hypothetical protein